LVITRRRWEDASGLITRSKHRGTRRGRWSAADRQPSTAPPPTPAATRPDTT
jgi:hypothetical protein